MLTGFLQSGGEKLVGRKQEETQALGESLWSLRFRQVFHVEASGRLLKGSALTSL